MEKYDIIIQGGQSNAEGAGRGETREEYLPDERILYLNAPKTVTTHKGMTYVTYRNQPLVIEVAEERVADGVKVNNFSLSFARDYVDAGLLAEDRKLLIIRAGIGATGFYQGHWGFNRPLYLKLLEMVEYALSLNPEENRLVGFLWHQGESDARRGTPPETYYQYITEMVADVRTRFNAEGLPFVAGDFVHHWKYNEQNAEFTEPTIAELTRACEEMGNGAFVTTEGLLSNNQDNGRADIIHFCRQAQTDLGHRYFKAYQTIVGK